MKTPYRFTLLSGIFTYVVLFIFAALWYRERMLFSDMAFQSFHILRTGALQVQSGRFGAAGTQVYPWLAQMMHFPLKSVLLSYSLGHVLYYFFLFLWVMVVLRQWRWGLAIVLFSVLMTTHTFYWLSEAPQGLAFLMALLAWMDTQKSVKTIRWWQWPLFIFGLITAFYFHPMVLYAMVFCCVWLFFYQSIPEKRQLWATGLALFGVLFFIKFKLLPLDWYDAMSLSRANAFKELWPNWLDIPSNHDFWAWIKKDYYLLPIFYLLSIGAMWYLRYWLLALWVVFFPLGYVLLVNIPFHAGDNQFYLENLYLPLALMVILPIVFTFEQWKIPPKFVFTALFVLILLRLGHIAQARQQWSVRLSWLEQFMSDNKRSKYIIPEQSLPKDILHFTWGIPYETLLLTSLKGPDSTRLVFQTGEFNPKIDSLSHQKDLFLGTFKNYSLDKLPERYFRPSKETIYER